jgi:cytosine/uracil/thiamine/allantoin permease
VAGGLVSAASHGPAKYGIPLAVAARTSFGLYGSRILGVLFVGAAAPWAAMLINTAVDGATGGLLSIWPSLGHINPLPDSWVLPPRLGFLRLCVLAAVTLLLLLRMLVPRDMAVGVRRTASLSTAVAIAVIATSSIFAYGHAGLPESLQVGLGVQQRGLHSTHGTAQA